MSSRFIQFSCDKTWLLSTSILIHVDEISLLYSRQTSNSVFFITVYYTDIKILILFKLQTSFHPSDFFNSIWKILWPYSTCLMIPTPLRSYRSPTDWKFKFHFSTYLDWSFINFRNGIIPGIKDRTSLGRGSLFGSHSNTSVGLLEQSFGSKGVVIQY